MSLWQSGWGSSEELLSWSGGYHKIQDFDSTILGFFFTPMDNANEFPLKEIRNVNKHQRNRLRVFTRFNGRKKNQNKSQKLTNYGTLTLEIDNIWGGPPVKDQSVDGVTHPVLQPPKHISLLWERQDCIFIHWHTRLWKLVTVTTCSDVYIIWIWL